LKLGPTAQLVALELAQLGFVPVSKSGNLLYTLLGESRSVRISHVKATQSKTLRFDTEFNAIREGLDKVALSGRLICIGADTAEGEIQLASYRIKWLYRLLYDF